MTMFALPTNLTRRAMYLLSRVTSLIDDHGYVPLEGSPASAMTTLVRVTGNKRRECERALQDLAAFELVRTWCEVVPGRRGPGTLRVRVLIGQLRVEDACVECGSPARGTGRWCARCKQLFGRDDRAWQIKALELHEQGLSPVRIAIRLDKPLYVPVVAADGRDRHGGAVVPFLINKGALGDEWAERLRDAERGVVEDG